MLTKGGEEGRITFNHIIENAKPVPGEATDEVQQIITKIKESNYTMSGLTSEELQLLLTKGGEEGRITLNRIMENAKPVPGEATPDSQTVLPPSQNYSYQKDLTTSQESRIDG